MNKKLAVVIYKYFPFGGLEKDFFNIILKLQERDIDFKIFCGEWNGDIPKGLKIKKIESSGFTNHKKNQNFYHQFSNLMHDFKPKLIFGFNKIPNLDIYFAGDHCYLHSSKGKNFLYKFTPRYKHFTFFENEVFGKGKTKRILLLNARQRNIFQKEYLTEEHRLEVVPPGLPASWYTEDNRMNLKEELNLHISSKIILFVGSGPRKGLDRAIKALASLTLSNDSIYNLLVAGMDDPKPYIKLAKKLNLENEIIFLGPRTDIRRLMANADLLIHPAREEPAGNVIIEAMETCLPILVAGEVGYSRFVQENKAGLVTQVPFNQEELNSKLKHLISDKERRVYVRNLEEFSKKDYFNSRYSFVADILEEELNA